MKKLSVIFLFTLFFYQKSYSPILTTKVDHNYINEILNKSARFKLYEELFYAVTMVESRRNPLAYNSKENAVGIAQIRPIRIKDYNIRTGNSLTLKDAYNPEIAKQIFFYYAELIGHENPHLIIRRWNGSGPMTYTYLNKVKKYLKTN